MPCLVWHCEHYPDKMMMAPAKDGRNEMRVPLDHGAKRALLGEGRGLIEAVSKESRAEAWGDLTISSKTGRDI